MFLYITKKTHGRALIWPCGYFCKYDGYPVMADTLFHSSKTYLTYPLSGGITVPHARGISPHSVVCIYIQDKLIFIY